MTPKERTRRFAAIVEEGCCVCVREGLGPTPPAIHHILEGRTPGRRNDDENTIGLCPYHHQHGPNGEAVHAGVESFAANHGSELELLAWTDRRIGWRRTATIAGNELPLGAAA